MGKSTFPKEGFSVMSAYTSCPHAYISGNSTVLSEDPAFARWMQIKPPSPIVHIQQSPFLAGVEVLDGR